MDAETTDSEHGLLALHQQLETHFSRLREARSEHSPSIPIFALEHGLTDEELDLLRSEVCATVQRAVSPLVAWLPFVIYAAEIGYEYSGDEYWQTFEARTPGWAEFGDRYYVKGRFLAFKSAFGGAEPRGAWARHFSIIAWPITHAILPTDLQRNLARLLYEFRHAFTADLLAEPAELGRRLAARSWHASSRFQVFAQDTDLLGQVATALLVGDEESTPYLLDSTLKRIVGDLSTEHEARRWLRDAKHTAVQVRARGFLTVGRGGWQGERQPDGTTGSYRALPSSSTDPEVRLRQSENGWTAYAEFPDLSPLSDRLPSVYKELSRLRARIAGVEGPPLARGRLLYPGQILRLDEWPQPGAALIVLKGGSAAVNALLAQQCVLSPGPRWLFQLRDAGLATEIKGKFVRPGHNYVLLSERALAHQLPTWIAEIESGTLGVYAYTIATPPTFEGEHLAFIRALGMGSVVDVEIRPAGLVPALWDGEGTAEWLAGENPVVALSSTQVASQCVVSIDSDRRLLSWPSDRPEMLVCLEGLEVGAHDLSVSLVFSAEERRSAEGTLNVLIRPPQPRSSTGSHREGMMILARPVNPTMTELWEGVASLEVLGPAGVRVYVEVLLTDRANGSMANHACTTELPVEEDMWRTLFEREFRSSEDIYGSYDEAESCLVRMTAPDLGTVSLRCDRELSLFRWAAGRDHDGPFVRLIDNTDEGPIEVDIFEFARPDQAVRLQVAFSERLRRRDGGLVVASGAGVRAAVVLPPVVRDMTDLQRLRTTPRFQPQPRSAAGVGKLIEIAALWKESPRPTDPFGAQQRSAVVEAIASKIAGLVGGERWERIEKEWTSRKDADVLVDMRDAIGDQRHHRAMAIDLSNHIAEFRKLNVEQCVRPYAVALTSHAYGPEFRREDERLSEFLLRLATDPGSLLAWPGQEVVASLQRTLESPVILRAARFVVLSTQAGDPGTQWSRQNGAWTWH